MNDNPPLTPKSKAVQVAQRLLDQIITANLSPGSSIGTEGDLLKRFEVSRPTLRESFQILESQGVLDRRPGPGGGIIVRKPGADILCHIFSVFLRLNEVPYIDVLRAREVIEPALAAEAAVNGTEEDFAEMEASIKRMETIKEQPDFLEENRAFHSVIARASGNKVLETFWSTLSILAHGEHYGMRYTGGNQQHVIEAHTRILKACRQRDGKAASELMYSHVAELEHLVRKRYQHLLREPINVVTRAQLR